MTTPPQFGAKVGKDRWADGKGGTLNMKEYTKERIRRERDVKPSTLPEVTDKQMADWLRLNDPKAPR
jgi:hypothetical protein